MARQICHPNNSYKKLYVNKDKLSLNYHAKDLNHKYTLNLSESTLSLNESINQDSISLVDSIDQKKITTKVFKFRLDLLL